MASSSEALEPRLGGKDTQQLTNKPSATSSTASASEDVTSPVTLKAKIQEVMLDHACCGAKSISPKELWKKILTRKEVVKELERYKHENIMLPETNVDEIWSKISERTSGDDDDRNYILFAMAVLADHGHQIEKIIDADFTLPLNRIGVEKKFHLAGIQNGWSSGQKRIFDTSYERLRVPRLTLGESNGEMVAQHYEFRDTRVLPWSRQEEASSEGGYGTVKIYAMNPECHDFDRALKQVGLKCGLFAVKTLKTGGGQSREEQLKMYHNEMEQLKRFSGMKNHHLVTLLASYTLGETYNFLFPAANKTLKSYMREEGIKNGDHSEMIWFSKQLRGLMEAVATIHDPMDLDNQYGRHGDLKPDNILWYDCYEEEPKGIMVISDMGRTSCHREMSRSNVPNVSGRIIPTYRPPESENEDATISRAFDIWSLGCIFLEMTIWSIEGPGWIKRFSEDTEIAEGETANNYYEFIDNEVRVKEAVKNCFNEIQVHKSCSQFQRDVVDTIEKEMMLCEAGKRTRASKLREMFNGLYFKCLEDMDYCVRRDPVLEGS